jgi:hypothetical protein
MSPGQRLAEHTRTLSAKQDMWKSVSRGERNGICSREIGIGRNNARRFLCWHACSARDERDHPGCPGEPVRLSRKRCLSTRTLEGRNPPCGDRQDKNSSHKSTSTELMCSAASIPHLSGNSKKSSLSVSLPGRSNFSPTDLCACLNLAHLPTSRSLSVEIPPMTAALYLQLARLPALYHLPGARWRRNAASWLRRLFALPGRYVCKQERGGMGQRKQRGERSTCCTNADIFLTLLSQWSCFRNHLH